MAKGIKEDRKGGSESRLPQSYPKGQTSQGSVIKSGCPPYKTGQERILEVPHCEEDPSWRPPRTHKDRRREAKTVQEDPPLVWQGVLPLSSSFVKSEKDSMMDVRKSFDRPIISEVTENKMFQPPPNMQLQDANAYSNFYSTQMLPYNQSQAVHVNAEPCLAIESHHQMHTSSSPFAQPGHTGHIMQFTPLAESVMTDSNVSLHAQASDCNGFPSDAQAAQPHDGKQPTPFELERETQRYYEELGGQPQAQQPDAGSEAQAASAPPVTTAPTQVTEIQTTWSLLHKYWQFVQENPYDFEGWTTLLGHVESMNHLEAARSAFEGFLPLYPYCFAYWKKFAEFELKLTDMQRCLGILLLGTKCVPFCPELWSSFLSHFLKYQKKQNIPPKLIRDFYELGLDSVGLSFLSSPFWEACIKLETDRGNLLKVMELYNRLLSIPLKVYNKHWEHFLALIRDHHPRNLLTPEEYLALRKKACEELKIRFYKDPMIPIKHVLKSTHPEAKIITYVREKIIAVMIRTHEKTAEYAEKCWKYEGKIKRPYFHVKALEKKQLKTWNEYLDFELKEDDPVRIVTLFERCLVSCALYEELWCRYGAYMEDHVRNILEGKYSQYKTYKHGIFTEKVLDEMSDDKGAVKTEENGQEPVDKADDKSAVSEEQSGKSTISKPENVEIMMGIPESVASMMSAAAKELNLEAKSQGAAIAADATSYESSDVQSSETEVKTEDASVTDEGESSKAECSVAHETENAATDEKPPDSADAENDSAPVGSVGSDEASKADSKSAVSQSIEEDDKDDMNSDDEELEKYRLTEEDMFDSQKDSMAENNSGLTVAILSEQFCSDIGVGGRVLTALPLTPDWILHRVTFEDVRQIYRRAAWIHCPSKPLILMQWAEFEESQGNLDMARELLNTVIVKYPTILKARFQLIELERRCNSLDRVEQLYAQTFLAVNEPRLKSCIAIRYARFVFKMKGDPDKALLIIRKAVKKDKGNPHLYHHVFDICYQREPVDVKGVLAAVCLALAAKDLTLDDKFDFAEKRVSFLKEHGAVEDLKDAKKIRNELRRQLERKQVEDRKKESKEDKKKEKLKKEFKKEAESAESEETQLVDLPLPNLSLMEKLSRPPPPLNNAQFSSGAPPDVSRPPPSAHETYNAVPPSWDLQTTTGSYGYGVDLHDIKENEHSSMCRFDELLSRGYEEALKDKKVEEIKLPFKLGGLITHPGGQPPVAQGDLNSWASPKGDGLLPTPQGRLMHAFPVRCPVVSAVRNPPAVLGPLSRQTAVASVQFASPLGPFATLRPEICVRPPPLPPPSLLGSLRTDAPPHLVPSRVPVNQSALPPPFHGSPLQQPFSEPPKGQLHPQNQLHPHAQNSLPAEMIPGQKRPLERSPDDGNEPAIKSGRMVASMKDILARRHSAPPAEETIPITCKPEENEREIRSGRLAASFKDIMTERWGPSVGQTDSSSVSAGSEDMHRPKSSRVVASLRERSPYSRDSPKQLHTQEVVHKRLPPGDLGRTVPSYGDKPGKRRERSGRLEDRQYERNDSGRELLWNRDPSLSHHVEKCDLRNHLKRKSAALSAYPGQNRDGPHSAETHSERRTDRDRTSPFMRRSLSPGIPPLHQGNPSTDPANDVPLDPVSGFGIPDWVIREGGKLTLSESVSGISTLHYLPRYLTQEGQAAIFKAVRKSTNWTQGRVKSESGGPWENLPYLISWIGPCDFTWKGLKLAANLIWPPEVLDLLHRLIRYTNIQFNSCLLNLFRDGHDCKPWFNEMHPAMENKPTVVVLSLGATRTIELRKNLSSSFKTKTPNIVRLPLLPGSLIVLEEAVHLDWSFQIPKEPNVSMELLVLSFRTMYMIPGLTV